MHVYDGGSRDCAIARGMADPPAAPPPTQPVAVDIEGLFLRLIARLEALERSLQAIAQQRFGDEGHGGRAATGQRTIMYWDHTGTVLRGRYDIDFRPDTLVRDVAPGASMVGVDIGGRFYELLPAARVCDVAPGTIHVRFASVNE